MKKIRVTVMKAGGGGVLHQEVFSALTLTGLKMSVGKYLMSLDLTGVESITMSIIE